MNDRFRVIVLPLLVALCGCARLPYRHGSADQYIVSPELARLTEQPIEWGERRPVIDTIGWVLGIQSKIVLWDRRIDNHAVTTDTTDAIGEYLAFNELGTVKVRVNQYAPLADWERLVANESVGWGWRYTAGTLIWLGETVFPGRIWGGDHYNPFTNTIHLFSDVPAVAIHEAGHAKDFARRKWKGSYAVVYVLPVVPLWHEAIATNDALGYLHENGEVEELQEAYQILYPAYGTYVGNAAGEFLPWNNLLVFAGAVVPAHIAGRWKAWQVSGERMADQIPAESAPETSGPEPALIHGLTPLSEDAWVPPRQ